MNLDLPLFEYDEMANNVVWTYFSNSDIVEMVWSVADIYIRVFAVFFVLVFFFSFAVRFVESIVTGNSTDNLGDYLNE